MPHSLGSPGEFDPNFRNPEPEPQPENPGNIRRIEDELEQQDMESLGPETPTSDDIEEWPVSEDPEFQDDSQVQALQELILGAALQRKETEYVLYPEHLAMFVHHEIMEKDEARDYLRSRGINLR